MTNKQFDSLWMFNRVSAFDEAVRCSRLQDQKAQRLQLAQPYVSMPDVQKSEDQLMHKMGTGSSGLIIRFAGMTAGVVAVAVIATVGFMS